MEDKILDIKDEMGTAIVNLRNGKSIPVEIKTTYTIYQSGRKDCNVHIIKPISAGSQAELQ